MAAYWDGRSLTREMTQRPAMAHGLFEDTRIRYCMILLVLGESQYQVLVLITRHLPGITLINLLIPSLPQYWSSREAV